MLNIVVFLIITSAVITAIGPMALFIPSYAFLFLATLGFMVSKGMKTEDELVPGTLLTLLFTFIFGISIRLCLDYLHYVGIIPSVSIVGILKTLFIIFIGIWILGFIGRYFTSSMNNRLRSMWQDNFRERTLTHHRRRVIPDQFDEIDLNEPNQNEEESDQQEYL